MRLVDEVGGDLDGLSQLRALIAGRKPGILVALDFEFIEVEAGRAVFAGTPGSTLTIQLAQCMGGMPPHCSTRRAAARCIPALRHCRPLRHWS
jgi:hypothetical protein